MKIRIPSSFHETFVTITHRKYCTIARKWETWSGSRTPWLRQYERLNLDNELRNDYCSNWNDENLRPVTSEWQERGTRRKWNALEIRMKPSTPTNTWNWPASQWVLSKQLWDQTHVYSVNTLWRHAIGRPLDPINLTSVWTLSWSVAEKGELAVLQLQLYWSTGGDLTKGVPGRETKHHGGNGQADGWRQHGTVRVCCAVGSAENYVIWWRHRWRGAETSVQRHLSPARLVYYAHGRDRPINPVFPCP